MTLLSGPSVGSSFVSMSDGSWSTTGASHEDGPSSSHSMTSLTRFEAGSTRGM